MIKISLILTQTALMSETWPVKVCLHMPSRMSQSLEEASQAPDTKVLESGLSDRLITSPVWPVKLVACWPVSISHSALGSKSFLLDMLMQHIYFQPIKN